MIVSLSWEDGNLSWTVGSCERAGICGAEYQEEEDVPLKYVPIICIGGSFQT
jgi:hypothetical protein